MKKLTTLALAAGLIVAAAAPASAVDTTVSGQYDFAFQRAQKNFTGQDIEQTEQRFRLGLTFAASENLSGFVQFETRESWGVQPNRLQWDNVTTRLAYIDWVIPGTAAKVRMGKFEHGVPAEAFAGNQVMGPGSERTGIQVTTPVTDWMSLTAQWSRAYAADGAFDVSAKAGQSNTDLFSVYANLKFDGISVTPWAVVGFGQNGTYDEPRGKDENHAAGRTAEMYQGGVLGTLTMFDPLTVKAAFGIGHREYSVGADRTGWYAQVNASYKLAFGTPSFGFWYGSGDDADAKYAFQNWVPTNKGKFAPSTTYYDNAYGMAGGQAWGNIAGTWGLKLGLNGVSFLDGLTHDFAVVMINGTNHDNMAAAGKAGLGNYLTWSDTVYEFDFDTTYQIYKNLTAKLELAYVLNDLDEDFAGAKTEDDWRAALNLRYKF